MENLSEIFSQFKSDSELIEIKAYGSGHINDTYKVECVDRNYLLQRINHRIFNDIEGLTNNIVNVTQFLRNKVNSFPGHMQVLNPALTKTGKYNYKDGDGNFWRVFDFIEGSRSFDSVDNAEIAFEGGKVYGGFVRMLTDFPAYDLVVTIPNFHDTDVRISNFRKSVKENLAKRVGLVKELIFELEQRSEGMNEIHRLGEKGIIPQRVTHNDTKINNILFDDNNRGICVIDLDTVMPGYVHYDFGDAIRTFTNRGNEDEAVLSKVSMNIELFEAFTKGFLSESLDVLSSDEINLLAFSAKYIVYEQSIRFLSDYLNGDVYYKIKFPEHNLVRARAQFKLLQSIEEQYDEMQQIINKLTGI